MTAKEQVALSVLEYWHAIEFLGQDSYETCTDAHKLTQELSRYKKTSEQEKASRKQIMVYTSLDEKSDIHSLIVKEASTCGMRVWGNLTFYIGRVKRQGCIRNLAERLGHLNLQQAEESTDDIAILSFQCDQRGMYVRHSLSLSTIVWALSQVSGREDAQISELLSESAYRSTIDSLEIELFGAERSADEIVNEIPTEFLTETLSDEESPVFSEDAVTGSDIVKVQAKLVKTYGKFLSSPSGTDIEPAAAMKFQLFRDQKAKEKYDDDNYMGLSYDFFSHDLKMVKDCIKNDNGAFEQGMLRELVEYICAPHNKNTKWKRHDLVRPNDRDVFAGELLDILHIRNAPLGKWPSRYMPALMQQAAVNLALSNTDRSVIGQIGKVFSVNGPPGTGKTTMLKEIIAEHIVEKARLLSDYQRPDDAFKAHAFQHGDKNGAYSTYYPSWFSFLDGRIGDHGVLVLSCNNAAVENITKELPLSSGISNQLKVQTEGEHPDGEEMQRQLNEIAALFSISSSSESIHIYKNDSKREGEYPEIYFTGYARKLLGKNDCDADAWGLITAPLGKKSNINNFYYDVLNPLWQDFLMKNLDIEERVGRYQAARDQFLTQLSKVEELRDQLSGYADSAQAAHAAAQHYKMMVKRSERGTANANVALLALAADMCDIEQKINTSRAEYDEVSAMVAVCSKLVCDQRAALSAMQEQEIGYQKKALDTENSVSFWTKILRKGKYQAAVELAASYTRKAEEYSAFATQYASALQSAESNLIQAEKAQAAAAEKLSVGKNTMKDLQKRENELRETVHRMQNERDIAKNEMDASAGACDILLKELRGGSETDCGTPIDAELISNILSEDKACSTQAQLVNPWVTQRYNREREKLFYRALQMTKEFLLSSKRCRANLCILGQYWGLRTESDTDRIVFHEADRQAMVSSLFQTLFLLTPVISSTFASVGRLLKDMTKPGSIGTLMIDEAGQAQPQMAVGAMYRARKVLVVGDPKQVEPVVTDDLNLLKEAYSEPVYGSYKSKSLSVQSCADIINPFGTFFENGTDQPDWVGCPLLVHRRCISPMYDISNQISYGGIMKQQTLPPSEKKKSLFVLKGSQWINVAGDEIGHKDHYVPAQGAKACELVELAFERADFPNLYIIAPFNKVVSGIRKELYKYAKNHRDSALAQKHKHLEQWIDSNIGTVHKFQGKEADEVIFLLGCDAKQKNSYAVKGFVNSNLVNVAVTRAKYRLYIIGDARVWQNNPFIRETKAVMDILPLEIIAEIGTQDIPDEEKREIMLKQAAQLPGAASFTVETGLGENGEPELLIDSDEFVANLDRVGFLGRELSETQVQQFGFASKGQFEALPDGIKKNLLMAMKLYFLLRPIYQDSADLDASCCGILFCKATELRLRENFIGGLKKHFPNDKISGGRRKLEEAKDTDFMIGTICHILEKNVVELAERMRANGDTAYTEEWWNAFVQKLNSFAKKRNTCCHPQLFCWSDMRELLTYGFKADKSHLETTSNISGVFFASSVGEKLIRVDK